jgi:hypothetical protein
VRDPINHDNDDDQGESRRLRMTLLGMLGAIILIGLGIYLVDEMKMVSDAQDCAMSGRKNCFPIDKPQ